jgi:hypothetical protein
LPHIGKPLIFLGHIEFVIHLLYTSLVQELEVLTKVNLGEDWLSWAVRLQSK